MVRERIYGIILAGGQSSRMGTDKAMLQVGGRSLLSKLAGQMLAFCDWIVVAVGDGRHEAVYRHELRELGDRVRFVRDRYADSGPLAGLHAALGAMPAGYAFVMACDMPRVSETLARRMLKQLDLFGPPGGDQSEDGTDDVREPAGDSETPDVQASGDRSPDVIRTADQPFHAFYHTRAAAQIGMMLAQGDFRVMGLPKRLSARLVEPATEQERAAFANLNTPEAYERFMRNEAGDSEG